MRLLEGHCDHQPSASHPQQPSIRLNAFGEFVCAPEDLTKVFNWPHRTTPNYYALEATAFFMRTVLYCHNSAGAPLMQTFQIPINFNATCFVKNETASTS